MPGLELPQPPWVVGHRGVRGPVPENTAASVREAVAQGADMVEIDVQVTAGGEWVVFHDSVVRLPGRGETPVAGLSVDERRRCRPTWRRGGEEVAYELPVLAEVLAAAPPGLPLNLEVKRYDAGPGAARLAEALLRAVAGRPGLLYSSFHWPVLEAIRALRPRARLALLAGEDADWRQVVAEARRLEAWSIHLHRRLAERLARAGELHRPAAAERPLLVYTVNSGDRARRLRDAGVSGFFTDRPAALRAELALN